MPPNDHLSAGQPVAVTPDAVWAVVRRTLVLLQLALTALCFGLPLLATHTDPGEDRTDTYRVLAGLAYYWDRDLTDPEPPFTTGVWTIRVALILLVVAVLIGAVCALVMLVEGSRRGVRLLAQAAAGVLIGSSVLLVLAQFWVDSTVDGAALQSGLLAPAAAGLFLLSLCAAKLRLDGTDGLWAGPS